MPLDDIPEIPPYPIKHCIVLHPFLEVFRSAHDHDYDAQGKVENIGTTSPTNLILDTEPQPLTHAVDLFLMQDVHRSAFSECRPIPAKHEVTLLSSSADVSRSIPDMDAGSPLMNIPMGHHDQDPAACTSTTGTTSDPHEGLDHDESGASPMHSLAGHATLGDISSSDSADIEISDVTIKSHSVITSIELSIENTLFQRNFNLAKDTLKEITLTLAPERPSLSSSSTSLTVAVYTKRVFNGSKKFKIKRQDLLSNAATVDAADSNKREYRVTVDGIELAIGFTLVPQPQTPSDVHVAEEANVGLRPIVDKIFDICPRFRVLVIGRTGAGKTSLIKNTFGVTESHISPSEVGECDINKEIYSEQENKRFVLHDSKGFEPGDEGNFETVIKFLNDRKEKGEIKDQVHAVWLCFSIPIAGDRLFETGTENFLRLLSDGQLGKMPIIAIFTKYDRLVDYVDSHASDDAGLAEADARAARAKAKLHEICVQPFREQIGVRSNIPDIFVSTENEYKWTLRALTQLTTELVGKYLSEDVALLSAVAQQVAPSVKLEAVIAVAKNWYWKVFAISLRGNQTEIVHQIVHGDIIRIWNLQDPRKLLDSDQFISLVGLVGNQATSSSMLVKLNNAPQQLMIYIVSLMLVMQIIFVITTSTWNVVSRRLIKVALKTFIDSPQRVNILSAIQQHFQRPGAFLARDAALQKITELIESNLLSIDDIAEIKDVMQGFDIKKDEPWY